MPQPTLSIAISQASLGLAIFLEQRLTFLEVHSLQGLPKPAEASPGYVLRCVDKFRPERALMQRSPDEPENVRAAVFEALRAVNCPLQEIPEQEVFSSFGDPPIADKQELRSLIRALFPQVPSTQLVFSCLDAVAAGLHFETMRLLAAG